MKGTQILQVSLLLFAGLLLGRATFAVDLEAFVEALILATLVFAWMIERI